MRPAHRSSSTRPSASRGFTLVELMVVVALISTVCGMGIWSLSGSLRVQQAADLARGIAFGMMRARADAVADGTQRRLSCTATGCVLQTASAQGMGTPASWNAATWSVYGGTQAQVWALDAATDVTMTNPGAGPLGSAQTVTFFPDGTASAGTVFVRDVTGAKQFKVFVYPATGMARIVDSW